MMILAAVLLVIGLIALAGMVARVNQLGSQTAVEADKPILGEVGPLSDALETGLFVLADARPVTGITTAVASTSLTFDSGDPILADEVGSAIQGTGIQPGTTIVAVSGTTATLSAPATVAVSGPTAEVQVGFFALSASTTPTLEQAVAAYLEQVQRIETARGYVMDYELTCVGVTDKTTGAGGNAAQGYVVAHLSDGTVWLEIRTFTTFVRSTCASAYG